ncbi:hypothetical protein, variant 1 [Puccinia triticina 1-1 BBBD Race 1]|uniref:Uncharacterized protein n=2 Tax=Puccinia triticina TaxID=208348 RepID=A0A180GFS4_PUCT1|nr:uncharacterized protein PtA15_1A403 [Puccinia triticina]OAV91181.1 hypothetical protein PTTG_04701 [Puccinia triticina 1-1 BBBD Race 1]OAV91182.1 hypothetical protein, variant 1 [Puccinia triticina 1-1 BBBD Race 1]WAQ81065.1 hypothetical protein PtA15_1A403 [Puccinia triticina]WAR51958.1 hypothetical protein PtB15_1B395 [Puccinia triticina]
MLCKTPKSTSWNLSDSPDLTGRVAIVTGGSTGTGYFISLELARKGAKVYLVCRNEERAQRAIISLRKELPDGSFDYIHFDLTRLRTCKDAASTFLKRENRLDILINNAAVSRCSSYSLSEDGIEIQACNTVGHFCLTERLVPLMKRTAQVADGRHARIVNITSASHKLNSEPDFASSQGLNQRRCSALERHGNSMLSIIVFNRELQRRLQGTGIICLAVHPGFISDQVLQNSKKLRELTMRLIPHKGPNSLIVEAKDAAFTPLYAAIASEVERLELGGSYLVPPGRPATPHPNARDPTGIAGQKLWATCLKIVYYSQGIVRNRSEKSCFGPVSHSHTSGKDNHTACS